MRRLSPSLALFLFACAGAPLRPAALDLSAAQPEVARKEAHPSEHFGESLPDDYYWLKQKNTPAVEAYLNAENAYTAAAMKPTEPLQEALYQEMVARIQETDLSVPFQRRGYHYYFRTEKGKQYPIQCRKKGSLEGAEEIVLDQNEMARNLKFLALGPAALSDDNQLLAYSTDTTGFRQFDLHLKNLRTGAVLADTAPRVTSMAWAADNKTLFYTVEDPVAKRSYRLYRHQLGAAAAADTLLYEEKDERFGMRVSRTRSLAYLILGIGSHTTSEDRYLPAAEPLGEWKVIAPREQDREYYTDHGGEFFYIRENSTGRNFRLVTAPLASPGRESWKEVVAHRGDVMLQDFDVFKEHYVLDERVKGVPELRVVELKDGSSHTIALPEASHFVGLDANPEFDSRVLRYSYESNITPRSVYDYDLATHSGKLLKRTPVNGYDQSLYAAERIEATAADGTQVPISVVYKKTTPRDGTAPMLLTAYGSYGFPLPVTFSSASLSLLDRGFILAAAHIRGGGELGKKWHDQGRMLAKMNTFTDFNSSAEHLIKEHYTSSDRLGILGGSAGGLLMGAVTNLRPELFKTVIALVPFVDVINTMSDETLPLTVAEFEEWGNPKVEAEYRYIRKYSPYDNVAAKAYPSMLVRSSYNDSQVMYWEPAKYVAKLRSMKTDTNPLLFRCDMDPAGHGGKSGRYERLRTTAFDYAWLLTQLTPPR